MTDDQALTRKEAEALGWTFEVDIAIATATKGSSSYCIRGGPVLFFLLAFIAQAEGIPFAEGWGGSLPVTPENVFALTGESYEVPLEAAPILADRPALEARIATALDELDPKTATVADMITALRAVVPETA